MPNPTSRATIPHLQSWRLRVPLTQEQLAKEAGVGVVTIIRAEQGKPVNAFTAAKLAKALGVTVKQLEQGEPK